MGKVIAEPKEQVRIIKSNYYIDSRLRRSSEIQSKFLPQVIKNEADILIIEVIDLSKSNFIVVTSPTVAGYKIKEVLGIVTGLSPRTRGVGGTFKAAFQTIKGGEIKAFTSEIEKARVEAIERTIEKAKEIGANAIISMDVETSNMGETIMLISATGTAVIIEPE